MRATPLSKFVNEKKLDVNMKGNNRDDKKSNKAKEAVTLSATQKRNEH